MEKNKKLKTDLEVIESVVDALDKNFDRKNDSSLDRYVVAYYVDDQLWGYHASTWCQVVDDKNAAKRYIAKDDNSRNRQMQIIYTNLKALLNSKEGDIGFSVKETHWKGITINRVQLDTEQVLSIDPDQIMDIKLL